MLNPIFPRRAVENKKVIISDNFYPFFNRHSILPIAKPRAIATVGGRRIENNTSKIIIF